MKRLISAAILAAVAGLSAVYAQRPAFVPVTDEMLRNPSPDDWLMFSRTYDNHRFSPLKQITRENVTQLKEVFKLEFPKGTQESIPLVYRGVMYVMVPPNSVRAIDAAEWVGPYLDRALGLHNAAKHYYSSGWHEPSTTTEVIVNKDAYDSLPSDLQAVLHNAAAACNITSHTWIEAQNGDALQDLVTNHGVQFETLPDDVIRALFEATRDILATEADKDPLVKRINDSFWEFKKKHDGWQANSEAVFANTISRYGQGMA